MSSSSESHGTHDLNAPVISAGDLVAAEGTPPTEFERVAAELHLMKTAGIVEVAVRNPSVSEYMDHWEGRATAAEARIQSLMTLIEDNGSAWLIDRARSSLNQDGGKP